MPRNGRFFGHFFGIDLGLFAQKTSLFLASKNANSFVCTRWLGLFRQKSIFIFISCRSSPSAGSISKSFPAPPLRALPCDN
jgi:hypothetical protein